VLLDERSLHENADCPRVRSLDDLQRQVLEGAFG
jgi:hypothetical protein